LRQEKEKEKRQEKEFQRLYSGAEMLSHSLNNTR
jgi:hypothetical protein